VDEAWAGRPSVVSPATELQLEQVYSRGLGPFFVLGTDHQAVVKGRAPRHRGVLMGRVAQATREGVLIEPADAHSLAPLKPGDGVVFDAAGWRSPEEPEEGGRVFQVLERGGALDVRFGNGAIDPGRIRQGDLLWRTSDPDTAKAARPYLEPAAPLRRQPVRVRVVAREGEALAIEWTVGGIAATVRSEAPLGVARDRAVTVEHLTAHLGRLGGTPYELAGLDAEIAGAPFAPASMLNDLRRRAVEELQRRQGAPRPSGLTDESVCPTTPRKEAQACGAGVSACHLHLLVRNAAQLDAALSLNPASITLDYLDLYGLRPSLDRIRAASLDARVASPRVLKPGEERIVDFLTGCGCAILVRSMGLLDALRGKPHGALIGDFSLNAANAITAAELLGLGLDRIAPTHDLNAAQVAELARKAGAARIEAIAYQHIPVFHTEHCVFCRFLSTGTSYRDCGRPCESHRVALRDDAGRAHPVLADVGCRNTVFGAEAQHAAAHLEDWLAAGIRHFRLEFAHESAEQVEGVTRAFADALAGRLPARELARRLQRLSPEGVTEGSLYVPQDYLALPALQ
jgi:putative protease